MKKRALSKKNYLLRIRESLDFSNLKKGFDEEILYGPLCLLGMIIIIVLFIFRLISFKIFFISFGIICYIFLIYFPFHRKKFTIFAFFLFGIIVAIFGIYSLFSGKNSFSNIKLLSILFWGYLLITFSLEAIACSKHKLKEVDLTLGYFSKKWGLWSVFLLIAISPLAYLVIAGTYYLFGKEHIYLWLPVFFFWSISIIRLFIYKILR